ncbi:MAG TPA: hypothetical protein VEQ18_00875, partial [Candidatus Nitrosocosmicus sp.]|nr:hypothetical protein [Candidatus Nitrosocosmicus sp.]
PEGRFGSSTLQEPPFSVVFFFSLLFTFILLLLQFGRVRSVFFSNVAQVKQHFGTCLKNILKKISNVIKSPSNIIYNLVKNVAYFFENVAQPSSKTLLHLSNVYTKATFVTLQTPLFSSSV